LYLTSYFKLNTTLLGTDSYETLSMMNIFERRWWTYRKI